MGEQHRASLTEREIQGEKRRQRLLNELDQIRELARFERTRLQVFDERVAGGLVLGFTVGFDVKTCTVGREFTRKQVAAVFDTEPYPDDRPHVRLWSRAPRLYLPAVAAMAELPNLPFGMMFGQVGQFLGPGPYVVCQVCLFQGGWNENKHKLDLTALVRQAHLALTLDPGVLNAPGDALDEECTRLFALHRDEYELPLEPPLGYGTAPMETPSSPSPRRRFVVEEV